MSSTGASDLPAISEPLLTDIARFGTIPPRRHEILSHRQQLRLCGLTRSLVSRGKPHP